jgi:hypothetical protein
MKIAFVYYGYENAGSMLDLRGYTRAAMAMGHEVIVYGPPEWAFALNYSKDLTNADALVFVVEWTTALQFGDSLDWLRLLDAVPRERRVVIDCDGHYNEPIWFMGDYNHRSIAQSTEWIDFCDTLSDKIFQPTHHPRRKNVRPFLFHIYDPAWESPIAMGRAKPFDMIYVGHTKHRWRGMLKVCFAAARSCASGSATSTARKASSASCRPRAARIATSCCRRTCCSSCDSTGRSGPGAMTTVLRHPIAGCSRAGRRGST